MNSVALRVHEGILRASYFGLMADYIRGKKTEVDYAILDEVADCKKYLSYYFLFELLHNINAFSSISKLIKYILLSKVYTF